MVKKGWLTTVNELDFQNRQTALSYKTVFKSILLDNHVEKMHNDKGWKAVIISFSRHIIWTLFFVVYVVVGNHIPGKTDARFISNHNQLHALRDINRRQTCHRRKKKYRT